jgi:hypothetical protein
MEWRPIPGFPGYEVSDTGSVRHGERILKGCVQTDPGGYTRIQINLYKDGNRTTFTVSRLIAQVFLPNPDNLPTVDHIDQDSTNNHVSNLRWASEHDQAMNKHHAIGVSGLSHIGKYKNKWRVKFKRHGQIVFCKYFPTKEEAEDERDEFLLTEWLVKQVDQGLL